jgi:hypothetical protein
MKTAAILGLVSLAGIAGAAISVHHSAAQANDGLQCTLTRVTTTYGFGPMKIEKSEPFIWTFKFLPNDKAQLIAPSSDMTVEVPVKATATRYELFEKSETKDGDQSITLASDHRSIDWRISWHDHLLLAAWRRRVARRDNRRRL